ncbi:uncharacterized protein LOC130990468 [Salvia miltiorrhiza]|uniref:uncharacterized protein LOC130990468 n=1 Tax=Salvia miltiorrhiza TaxID=226208 RepID=UPI0025AD3386|nr:uncharacterized protein LOC130990468 [Salvia miltiorrhiza]
MSEKENEVVEREIVDHGSHEHPLTLVETRLSDRCIGCGWYFSSGEKAYGCSQKCGEEILLHEECATLPRKIRHPMHPQHILTQTFNPIASLNLLFAAFFERKLCAICELNVVDRIFYKCRSTECKLWMHMKCAQGSSVMDAGDDEQSGSIINHPSHLRHGLKLVRRSCPFKCDACGVTRRGKSYICCAANCQYWIHERCASLPQTIKREDHHHSLSLSFHVPSLYIKYNFKCDVCTKYLMPKYWIYHCELCSYAVHLNCAFNKPPHVTREKKDDKKGIMEFPISDHVGEELIGSFVKRQGGAISIPHHDVDYKFHNYKLRLVSSSSSQEEEEENSDDDGEDQKSELICDGCITPIFGRKQRPSFSSSSKDYYFYMSCSSGCNYNLHMACFNLPSRLHSIPLHHEEDHNLILESCDKLPYGDCYVCNLCSNGLFYACTGCEFKADIKCASMPSTIYHTAHPQHPLNLLSQQRYQDYCGANCNYPLFMYDCYACVNCDFIVHVPCVGLPASITSRRWDKHHPLLLTYDANLTHPGDFYCDECEREMNPKSWMYHCRHCDISFHPHCFITESGGYRNIKLGKEYVNAAAHPHPLAHQLLTTKRRCDVCRLNRYKWGGFQCASCNFFICYILCGYRMLRDGDMKAVD